MEIINITDEIIEINVTEAVVNVVTQTGAYPLPSNVFSVFGRVGNVVGQLGDYTTSIVAEGTNLYYTDARSRAAISENITGMEYSSASGIFSLTSGYVIPTQAMLDAKVPYTGATGNVTLGEHQLTAGQVAFDQTPTGSAGVGVMRWNDTDGTLDLGLKGGNVTLQVGQEMVARVVNKTGADLLEANYQVVRISSAQGQRLAVQLAQANNDANSVDTIGIVTETITNNQEGFITILGQVKEINTTGSLQGETWADGDVLYLSPTTAGKITNIKPTAPQHMVAVGYVEYAHAQHGKIFCKVQNGYELEELHDVAPLPYIDKGVLYRDTATNLWKSATIGTLLGYTPVTSARTISTTAPLTGGGDLSADRTLSMPAATTSANGYLTSTDWNTFNNKENFLASGTTAQYYRGDKTFQTLNTTAVTEGTNLYYTAARFNTAFSGKTTTDLAEGTNLYYTDARARAAISGTLPISVSSGVVSITQAGGAANGYLSSTDWNTFNNKQAALNGTGFVKISGTTISYDNSTYLTTIEGITAGGELSGTYASPSLVNSAVTGKILSGVNITGGTISDTDSILTAFGKLQNQVNGLIGGSIYKGTWNATTNTPTIASGVGTKGNYYIVSVSGTTTIDGISDWNVGDWIIYDGTAWQQVDNTDAVVSVNGETGAVSLTTSNIAEGTNLYFTNARAIASTLTGYTSGAGTISSSDTILQAIQKLNGNVSGLVTGVSSVFGRTGAVTAASGDYTTTQVTEGTNLYYTDVRVSANSDVAANTAARHSAVTLGTANGLSLSTQQLSLAAASSSTTGALTSTDWNTFNGKQAALNGTGFVKISGTTISYDNSTYLTTSAASSTYLPLAGGTLTGDLTISKASTPLFQLIDTTNSKSLLFGADDNNTFIRSSSSTPIILQVNGGDTALTLSSTGTATFGNDVFTYANGGIFFNGGGDYGTGILQNSDGTINLQAGGGIKVKVFSTGRINFNATETITTGNQDIWNFLAPNQTGGVLSFNIGKSLATYNNAALKFHYIGNNSSSNFLGIGFYDNDNILNIKASGLVGIGLTNSAEKLGINSGNIKLYSLQNSAEQYRYIGSEYSPGNGNNKAEVRFGIQSDTYSFLSFATANGGGSINERVRITSLGNLTFNTTSVPSGIVQEVGGTTPLLGLDVNFRPTDFVNTTYAGGQIRIDMRDGQKPFSFLYRAAGSSSDSTLLSIGSNGKVFVNTTSDMSGSSAMFTSIGGTNLNGIASQSDNNGACYSGRQLSTSGYLAYWLYNTTNVGSITTNGTNTAYNTSSDYRLKQDLKDYKGLDLVSAIKTYDFAWKVDESRMFGVLAHELQEVIPYAVNGEKDGEQMQGVDYSKLVPVLVKAIQEQQAQIEELKAKILSL